MVAWSFPGLALRARLPAGDRNRRALETKKPRSLDQGLDSSTATLQETERTVSCDDWVGCNLNTWNNTVSNTRNAGPTYSATRVSGK